MAGWPAEIGFRLDPAVMTLVWITTGLRICAAKSIAISLASTEPRPEATSYPGLAVNAVPDVCARPPAEIRRAVRARASVDANGTVGAGRRRGRVGRG